MEFKIECPRCKQHYSVDESFLGQNVKCSVCGKAFKVNYSYDNIDNPSLKKQNYFSHTQTQTQTQTQYGFLPHQQSFIQQQYPQGYNVFPQQSPQQGYCVPPQEYPQQKKVSPQGYPPHVYGIPQQESFSGEYKPKSRIAYIICGIILGLWGGHDFYAGLEPRGFVHLGCAILTIACGIFGIDGLRFFLLIANGIWTLAEIIVINKDGNGVRMR